MKEDSSTNSWAQLGREWLELAQSGESRIHFIMPYMLKIMGDVEGKRILDLGCGDGGYARELTKRNAHVVAIDCSKSSIDYSKEEALRYGMDIEHHIRNSNDLYGLDTESFDIVLCSMMLMDCEDLEGTLSEIFRVLKSNGKVFASVLHPCFSGNTETGIGRQGEGIDREVVVKNYFLPSTWEAPLYRGKTAVIWRHRTLEDYVKAFIKSGLTITDMNEPRPTQEQSKISTAIAWLQKVPLYLFWELKK